MIERVNGKKRDVSKGTFAARVVTANRMGGAEEAGLHPATARYTTGVKDLLEGFSQ